MEDNEKQLDTEQENNFPDDNVEEKDGVKYETNDNWQFEAEAPTLSDDIFASKDYSVDTNELKVEAPVQTKQSVPAGNDVLISRDKIQFAVLGVLVAAIIAVLVFLGIRYYTVPNGKEGDMMNPASVAATVDGTKISIGMFNYCYTSMVNNAEQNAQQNGLDTTKDYATQYTVDEDGNQISWLDYFEQTALEQLRTLTAYYNAGVEKGYTVTEKQQKAIDDYVETYRTSAASQGRGDDFNGYLQDTYGDYFTEDTFRLFLKQFVIGATYQGCFRAEQEQITDEQIEEYFNKDKNYYSQINFCYIAVEYDSTDDTTKAKSQEVINDYMSKMTDRQSVIDLIPELYSDYISQDVASAMEADSSLTEEEARRQAIDTYSQSIDATIGGGSAPFGEDINEWLFNNDTKIGSTNYYIDDSIGYAYIILKTEQPTIIDDPVYAVRHILIQPQADDEEKQNACDWTDEQWAAAEEKANSVLDEFNSGDKSELSFALLSEEKNEDTASTSSALGGYFGGFYEGVSEGYMQPEFENWATDDSRKYGETGIVKTEFGYHIMFFVYNLPTYKAQIIYEISSDNALDSIKDMQIKTHKSVMTKAIDNFYSDREQISAE